MNDDPSAPWPNSSIRQDKQDATPLPADAVAIELEPYPRYKDSGMEWPGKAPAHWELRRLKNWLDINALSLPEDTDADYAFDYLDIGAIEAGRLAAMPERMRFGDAPARARRIVSAGDTLVSMVRTYLKAVWWRPGQSRGELIASTGFAVLTPGRDTCPKFVSYYCQSEPFANRVMTDSTGIAYPAITEPRLGTLKVWAPPLPEQTAIARFLDYMDQHISRYIDTREKLIALLEEHGQVVISNAVTGRIDARSGKPYPTSKPSGVEWLGDLPAHWETRRGKRVFRPRAERARPGDTQLSATQACGVIAQADYKARTRRKAARMPPLSEQRHHVEVGDFVISMRNFEGGIERVWRAGCVGSSCIVLKSGTELSTGYFEYLFKSAACMAVLRSTTNVFRDGQDLSFDNFARIDLPFPPAQEQEQIAQAIGREAEAIASGIERSRRQIRSIREYRARLIADIVTGKFDVREAAAALPEADVADIQYGDHRQRDEGIFR